MSEFPATCVKIFDWNVWRIFRDEDKNILKIVLEKDGACRDYAFESQAKWIGEKGGEING